MNSTDISRALDRPGIESRIRAILVRLKPGEGASVDARSDLFQAGVLDSFGVVEFIASLEEDFGIRLANEDLLPQNLASIEAAASTVIRYLKGA